MPPVQHARRKVPIKSKAAIEEAIDYMVKQHFEVTDRTYTMFIFSDLSSETYRGCKAMPGHKGPKKKPLSRRITSPRLEEIVHQLAGAVVKKPLSRRITSPRLEEIANQLAGAVVFTKADALKAFLQVHLNKASSKLLVINTHKGRYRFKWMPFKAKMSQDVF